MAFLSDIRAKASDPKGLGGAYEIGVFGGNFALIEGHKGLLSISEEEVSARVKGGKVRVRGEKLKVKCVSRDEIWVFGKIAGVETEYEG